MADSIEVKKKNRFGPTFKGFLIGLTMGGVVNAFWAIVLLSKFHAR
jgi:hypothetical protein